MAKPTEENIQLPDFAVPMVRKLEDHFVEDDIKLNELMTNNNKGLILYFYPKDNTSGCTT